MIDVLSPATAPFAAALLLMAVIAAAEAIGLLFGVAPSSALDSAFPDLAHDVSHDVGADDAPDAGGLLSWLGVGRVPLLVWFVIFLTSFGLSGFGVQAASGAILGAAMAPLVASAAALAIALPASGFFARLVARVLPKTETESVSAESFVGRVAVVVRGVARTGLAAEARVKDAFGRTHHVRIEPDQGTEPLEEGAEALIIRRDGAVYRAVRNVDPALSPRV
ncbi:MAG: YqiJ family protein [Parvularculaceae bacterium]|nr:YqiJ family protein [Parvularculaceae bacterium]